MDDELDALVQRICRLEDREAISDLISAYGIAIDDRDIDAVLMLYSNDAVFAGNAFGKDQTGLASIRDYFEVRWSEDAWSNHFTHTSLIEFLDRDNAIGRVTGHAEHAYRGEFVVAANRYHDHYVRTDDGWRFARRENRILYLMPILDLPTHAEAPLRKRWPGKPAEPAELPADTESFQRFRANVLVAINC